MTDINLEMAQDPTDDADGDADLPHLIRPAEASTGPGTGTGRRRRTFVLAMIVTVGAVAALAAGLALGQSNGVQPASDVVATTVPIPDRVVALGRLLPGQDVIALSAPSQAGNARIAALHVAEGDRLESGQLIATLDTEPDLQAALAQSAAARAVARVRLDQVLADTRSALATVAAELAAAQVVAKNAAAEHSRAVKLHKRRVISPQVLDRHRTEDQRARRQVDIARARQARFTSAPVDQQPDVALARQQLAVAAADLHRAKQRLNQTRIVSPGPGMVLRIAVRAGERIDGRAVIDMADISEMTAELEVHQDQVQRVTMGAAVQVSAPALTPPMTGQVIRIRRVVERQTAIADNPAAGTDARIVRVRVLLASTDAARAARLIGLQVRGAIAVAPHPDLDPRPGRDPAS